MNTEIVKNAFWHVLINAPKDEKKAKEHEEALCARMYKYFIDKNPAFVTKCAQTLQTKFCIPQDTFEAYPMKERKKIMNQALHYILSVEDLLQFYKDVVRTRPTRYCDICEKYLAGKCKHI